MGSCLGAMIRAVRGRWGGNDGQLSGTRDVIWQLKRSLLPGHARRCRCRHELKKGFLARGPVEKLVGKVSPVKTRNRAAFCL